MLFSCVKTNPGVSSFGYQNDVFALVVGQLVLVPVLVGKGEGGGFLADPLGGGLR